MEAFVVGQHVFYVPKPSTVVPEVPLDDGQNEEADGSVAPLPENQPAVEIAKMDAVIVCVHKDDYPNIYYTIRVAETESERQTVEQRLEPKESKEEAIARLAEVARLKLEAEAAALLRHRREVEEAQQAADKLRRSQEEEQNEGNSDAKRQKGGTEFTPANFCKASGETINPAYKPGSKEEKKKGKDKTCVCS